MALPKIILLIGFSISALTSITLFFRTILEKDEYDPAEPKGKTAPAIIYSLTAAMSPFKKETAHKHWPTYIAGTLYHGGIFLGFAWLAVHFFKINLPAVFYNLSKIIFTVTGLGGIGILLKRIINAKMRYFSNPDDYFSNILVSGFQIVSLITLFHPQNNSVLFIYAALLFLYVPLGKLRHAIFFILTRIYLGLYYGKRGVWPPGRQES